MNKLDVERTVGPSCRQASESGPGREEWLLLLQFSAGTLPRELWTHEAHLIVGAWHVCLYGVQDAIERLRAGIRRLNFAHGTVNSDTSGYHETITVVYANLLEVFLSDNVGMPFGECLARLRSSPLANRNFLDRYYSPKLLFSTKARHHWVAPDLAPLPILRCVARPETRRS
jgi:hypothetical protein